MHGTKHLYHYTVIEKLEHSKSKSRQNIQWPRKIMAAITALQFLISLVELCKSFPKWVHEVCGIFIPKDIVVPLLHAECSNAK